MSSDEEGDEGGVDDQSRGNPSIWVYGEEVGVKQERWRRQEVPIIQPKQTR